jgi:selenocysteine lyase/cysteine desulfurase
MSPEIRADYPVLKKYTYLNTASSGILSKSIFEFRRNHDLDFLENASIFRDKYLDYVHSVKDTLGKVFRCSSDMIGLTPNYSWTINAVAEALSTNLKVLTVTGEYPSVVEPFKTRGFEIVTISGQTQNPEFIIHEIKTHKIDILLISAVQWDTGNYLTTSDFKEIRAEFPDLLILVDGTQYLGICPFNFLESGIDAMITSGYKWLASGYGNGFIMMSNLFLQKANLKIYGNNTIMDRFLTPYHNPGQIWEPGHIDTLNFTTMQKAIVDLHAFGLDNIEKQIIKLALTLKTGLVQSGYLPAQALSGNKHSGIVLLPGGADLVRKLKDQDILVSFRNGIRVSFHYYNNKEDITRFLEAFRLIIG